VSWQTFEHQADVGLIFDAADGPQLFVEAGLAYLSLVCHPAGVREHDTYELVGRADNVEDLLIDWLNDLVYLVEGRQAVYKRIDVRNWSETSYRAELHGEPADPERHGLRGLVKAATYHDLEVRHDERGWHARVILDV